jgi:chromosome segregation ATPase|tara:strand:+ start:270 stop:698 length:429 start_codon:yes stop_codon:yes gene_type:complete
MAEIEVGGIKFTGGKMVAVLTALSSAAGIVWAGALFWGDYMDMKDKIDSYVAPDMSHIEQQLAVQDERMTSIKEELEITLNTVNNELTFVSDDLRDLKSDTREGNKRLYELETQTQRDLIDIRKSIREQIEEALANPLAGTE